MFDFSLFSLFVYNMGGIIKVISYNYYFLYKSIYNKIISTAKEFEPNFFYVIYNINFLTIQLNIK